MSDGTGWFSSPSFPPVLRARSTMVLPSVDSSCSNKGLRVQQQQPTSSAAPDFSGLWIPLVTPFRGGG